MKFKGLFLTSAIAAASIGLTGCFGDSSSSSSTPATPTPTPTETTASGVVFDGYLTDATTCSDENNNKLCDTGEPTTQSIAGGVWSLTLTSDAQRRAAILILANANTRDEDNPTVAVDLNLALSAPAGSTVVNAVTTIVQNKIEEKVATAAAAGGAVDIQNIIDEAKAEVRTELGLTATQDPTTTDFIAISRNTALTDPERVEASRVAVTIEIVTQQLIQVVTDAKALGQTTTDAQNTALFNASVGKLNLSTVKTEVDTQTTQSTTPDDFTNFDNNTVTAQLPTITPPTITEINEQVVNDTALEDCTTCTVTPIVVTPPSTTGGTGTAG